MSQTDIDAILLDSFTTHDGIWGLYGIDDDRPVAMWSGFHAVRCVERLAQSRSRVAVAEWALADVTRRGATSCIAGAAATLAEARADHATWVAQAHRLEAARRITPTAPRESPFGMELGME